MFRTVPYWAAPCRAVPGRKPCGMVLRVRKRGEERRGKESRGRERRGGGEERRGLNVPGCAVLCRAGSLDLWSGIASEEERRGEKKRGEDRRQ